MPLIKWYYFVFQEYTEEIEKLKKDLLAARGKDGFYIAEENYQYVHYIDGYYYLDTLVILNKNILWTLPKVSLLHQVWCRINYSNLHLIIFYNHFFML